MRNSTVIGRVAAVAAVVVALVAVAVILLSGGRTYQVKAVFQNASQIVSGDLVEVAGNQIGTVSDIALTPSGQARADAEHHQQGVRHPAPGNAGDDPRDVAVGNRQPLRRAAAGHGQRAQDPQRRRDHGQQHHQRGRPRRDLQHARRADAQGPAGRVPGLRRAVQGQGQARPAGVRLPEPGDRRLERAVPRGQPQHRPVHELPGQDRQPGHRRLAAQRRPQRPGPAPVDDHRSAGRAADHPGGVAAAPAGLHAPGQHHVRQPAQRARRPQAAGRRLKAGRAQAAEAAGPAAAAGARLGPDAQGPVEHHQPARRQQRPDRADQARRPAGRRDRAQRSTSTARSARARSPRRPRRSTSRPPSWPPRARTRST